ncbi:hypothetical protein CI109_101692 [Kwoniella shandongensis]|uniref:Uncharacterized protein n=1 Tax=Kwoniella shandongensis TaxID=1734106 RepID=A0A5M6C6E2_9TREE|nr:uncharacterized protein CI109_001184 [Kwoniella shandongensis]KAA5530381.1 hypothetical protein CI109_001184 [Kwoniella shandongensis]
MPAVKREKSSDDSDIDPKILSTPKKAKSKSTQSSPEGKRMWTEEEDARFIAAIDKLVKSHLWNEVKDDPILGQRGNPGIRAHWIAMCKKLGNK